MPFRIVPRGLMCGIALLVFLSGTAKAIQPPAGPAKEVPELLVLNCFAGTWEVVIANGDAPQIPVMKGKATSKWILDGRYLEQTGALQEIKGGQQLKVTTLMTYDVNKKLYRTWTFVSDGQVMESEGKWDAATQTMTSVSKPESQGHIATTIANFAEAGIETWKMSVKDQAGKIVREMVGKNTRARE